MLFTSTTVITYVAIGVVLASLYIRFIVVTPDLSAVIFHLLLSHFPFTAVALATVGSELVHAFVALFVEMLIVCPI